MSNTLEYIEDRLLDVVDRDDAEHINITVGELRRLLRHARDKCELMDQIVEYQIEIQRLEKLTVE